MDGALLVTCSLHAACVFLRNMAICKWPVLAFGTSCTTCVLVVWKVCGVVWYARWEGPRCRWGNAVLLEYVYICTLLYCSDGIFVLYYYRLGSHRRRVRGGLGRICHHACAVADLDAQRRVSYYGCSTLVLMILFRPFLVIGSLYLRDMLLLYTCMYMYTRSAIISNQRKCAKMRRVRVGAPRFIE